MSQISPPIRILLIGSIVFLAAWFAVLRPGGEEVVDVPTPAPAGTSAEPTSPYGEAVQNAQGAAQSAEAAAAARAGEAPESSATTSASPATPEAGKAAAGESAKAASKGLPEPVAKAVAQKKTLVMLFWNKNALDDQAVRRELRGIDRHKGRVAVHVAPIKNVERYAPITRGVNLIQSPTVVVVDRKRTADALVGYVDRRTIDQTVSDALRSR